MRKPAHIRRALGRHHPGSQFGLDLIAVSPIVPPNLPGGAGSSLPSIVVVALGEPGVPVIVWACAAGTTLAISVTKAARAVSPYLISWRRFMYFPFGRPLTALVLISCLLSVLSRAVPQ